METTIPDAARQRWWFATDEPVLHSIADYLGEDTGRATCGVPVARAGVEDGACVRWCAECLRLGGWLDAQLPFIDTTTATVRDVALSILYRLPVDADQPDFEVTGSAREEVGPWFAATADAVCSTAASRDVREFYDEGAQWYYRLEAMVHDLRHGQGAHTERARRYLRLATCAFEHLMMLSLDGATVYLNQRASDEEIEALHRRHLHDEPVAP